MASLGTKSKEMAQSETSFSPALRREKITVAEAADGKKRLLNWRPAFKQAINKAASGDPRIEMIVRTGHAFRQSTAIVQPVHLMIFERETMKAMTAQIHRSARRNIIETRFAKSLWASRLFAGLATFCAP